MSIGFKISLIAEMILSNKAATAVMKGGVALICAVF